MAPGRAHPASARASWHLDAREVSAGQLVEGARRSTLEELADWTVWAGFASCGIIARIVLVATGDRIVGWGAA